MTSLNSPPDRAGINVSAHHAGDGAHGVAPMSGVSTALPVNAARCAASALLLAALLPDAGREEMAR